MERGSLLAGIYPNIEKKMKVLKEIAEAKIIAKIFQAGEGMPPHTNPTDVFVVVLSGKMVITVEEIESTFEVGDFIFFPAEAIHKLLCIVDAKILIIK